MNSPTTFAVPKRILVRGVNWLGDAVMSTPALLRLRERFPDAHIAMLSPEKLRDLWKHHGAVNETLSFAPGEGVLSLGRRLRQERFDLALVLPNSPRSAIEAWLAGIPHRIGHARAWRNIFLTRAVPPRSGSVKMHKRSRAEVEKRVATPGLGRTEYPVSAHQVHDFLHLAGALGADTRLLPPRLDVSAEEVEQLRTRFGITDRERVVIGLNAGAEYGPAKRWPLERFIAAAREIGSRRPCLWLIFGGKGDLQIAAGIETALSPAQPVINLAGRTGLRELCAGLKLCRVVVTNDTGPMHVAAAVGTRVVVPFGSTSPELTGPGLPGDERHFRILSDAPCSPCFLRECPIDFRCMNGIGVDRVAEAVMQALAASEASSQPRR